MNILNAHSTFSARAYAAAAPSSKATSITSGGSVPVSVDSFQPSRPDGFFDKMTDFFHRSNNRDLSELGYGMMAGVGGSVAFGLVGAVAGTLYGASTGHPVACMAGGVAIGGLSGAVAGWFATTPKS